MQQTLLGLVADGSNGPKRRRLRILEVANSASANCRARSMPRWTKIALTMCSPCPMRTTCSSGAAEYHDLANVTVAG